MNFKKKKCCICETEFIPKSSTGRYCSTLCRSQGRKNQQKKLMKKNRLCSNANTKKEPKKIETTQKNKKTSPKKFYSDYQKQVLKSEKEFGYSYRILVEGVEIHEKDFVDKVIKKIKEVK